MFLRLTTIQPFSDSLPTESKLSIYNNTSQSAKKNFWPISPLGYFGPAVWPAIADIYIGCPKKTW